VTVGTSLLSVKVIRIESVLTNVALVIPGSKTIVSSYSSCVSPFR
jgi:hypothetical protein